MVTSRTKLAAEFGAPDTCKAVELMSAPVAAKDHVLGNDAKAVLFHSTTPVLGSSTSTV